jgi:hypothetical protein
VTRSGTATRSNAVRPTKMLTITLRPEVVAKLDELAERAAEGGKPNRSGTIEALILRAR